MKPCIKLLQIWVDKIKCVDTSWFSEREKQMAQMTKVEKMKCFLASARRVS
jgi:hypothetical protein